MADIYGHQYSERYSRQLHLPGFGAAAQRKLLEARVLVVGAGGLGVPALQYLAGMGVGHIGIIDGDVISLSNLHRQVLYATEEVGRYKAAVAAAKLAALNTGIKVEPINAKLSAGNAISVIQQYDIVVDATDSFSARYLINDVCVLLGKPFVYGAVHQYEGHVSVFNWQDGPTYRCLYPSPPSAGQAPDCNSAGVLGIVPGIIGCRQALEVVKLITGIGRGLSGYLQVHDFLLDEQYRIRLKAVAENKVIRHLQDSYELVACAAPFASLQPAELDQWYKNDALFTLIDVREAEEFDAGHLHRAVNVPLATLPAALPQSFTVMPVVLYCQKGSRSAKALTILRQHYPQLELYELAGGIDNWLKTYRT
jgi:adenylyltransferase/sulfurtransferase